MTKADNRISFFSHFRGLLKDIQLISSPSFASLHRKTLYITTIDTLSKCRYPNETQNGKRFRDFVLNFGDWVDAIRVSLPQLRMYIDGLSSAEKQQYIDLINLIDNEIKDWQKGAFVDIHNDLLLADFNLINTPNNIRSYQHLELLWVYRNKIAHECRSPGYGADISIKDKAYYIDRSSENSNGVWESTWELTYPEALFCNLTSNCIINLESYCNTHDIDPYESYEFGSEWHAR